ncbi:hypothetical protein [Paenibacillus prosopidis]|uniref:Lipoprotein n=1 Tax=Paenibacillus prosopidis TaxID=630520 RepID=A0A368VL47_9BACL|nr:hypothetical protein [Paenibacillus prosopidis]RCW39721.1 hypothetical protein DFP97_1582 [Paenibacillus prosopidis]
MKSWAKVVSITLILFVIFGCSKANEIESYQPNMFTESDLSVVGEKKRTKLTIGMDKTNLEKVIGKPISETGKLGVQYNGITVFYRGNKVSGFVIRERQENENKYITSRGLEIDNVMNQLIEKYGDSGKIEEVGMKNSKFPKDKNVVYIFDLKQNTIIADFSKVQNPEDTYVISTIFDSQKEDKLVHILIGDYNFAVLTK